MLKKNWYLLTPLLLVILPALTWLYYFGVFGYSPSEATEALTHFFQSSTRYAGSAKDKFDFIKPGMDGRTVYEKIGMPFEGQTGLEWRYSLPTGTTPYYHQRKIIFERVNGIPRVKALVKDFHTPEPTPAASGAK